ncbi:MAG: thioredoxin domain-containing protein, partial [Anaerolineales bacterium]|nr:thioredoxin domain-containing protein [Anaerolineales bacterium]
AYLEDYAALILGLLALYQSDHNPRWYQAAEELVQAMVEHYRDPQGGFFDTADDHEALLLRPKDVQDNAIPSGNALAALALLQLAAYSGEHSWRKLAEEALGSMQNFMVRYPTGFAQWLNALDFALGPVQEVALVGKAGAPDLQALQTALWSTYRPRLVAACAPDGQATETPPLLANRPVQNEQATAYVCQGFVCQRPVNTAAELLTQLSQ